MSTAPKFTIRKAEKGKQKLRLGLVGPTGSGKTYTALIAAEALVEGTGLRIGCIDTERESSELYADEFDFDVIQLTESHNPQEYIDALATFAAAGNYGVVVVDSLSHAWMGKDGSLETVDKVATKGDTFGAWRKVTPMHNKLVDALLAQPYHVIATLRAKMDYAVEKDEAKGKTTVRKIGLAPVQRDGMEYEFTVVCEMDVEHNLIVGKTRYRKIDGMVVNKPRHELFASIREWIESGVTDRHASAEQIAEIRRLLPLANLKDDQRAALEDRLTRTLSSEKAEDALTKLKERIEERLRTESLADEAIAAPEPNGNGNGKKPNPDGATDKQRLLLAKLQKSHVFTELERTATQKTLDKHDTKLKAQELIDWSLAQIRDRKAAEKRATEGMEQIEEPEVEAAMAEAGA